MLGILAVVVIGFIVFLQVFGFLFQEKTEDVLFFLLS